MSPTLSTNSQIRCPHHLSVSPYHPWTQDSLVATNQEKRAYLGHLSYLVTKIKATMELNVHYNQMLIHYLAEDMDTTETAIRVIVRSAPHLSGLVGTTGKDDEAGPSNAPPPTTQERPER